MQHSPLARTLSGIAALTLVAGCASGPPGGPPGGGPGGRPESPAVFISPMGKPFRAEPGAAYPVAAWFAAADRDGDGRLTLDEFTADAEAFFVELDLDRDGRIGGAENRNYEERIAPEILGRLAGPSGAMGPPGRGPRLQVAQGGPGGGGSGGGPGGGGGPPGGGSGEAPRRPKERLNSELQGAGPYGLLGDPQPVRSADADQSQAVSRAEFLAAAKRRFERLDANRDGVLTLPELPRTRVQSGGLGRP